MKYILFVLIGGFAASILASLVHESIKKHRLSIGIVSGGLILVCTLLAINHKEEPVSDPLPINKEFAPCAGKTGKVEDSIETLDRGFSKVLYFEEEYTESIALSELKVNEIEEWEGKALEWRKMALTEMLERHLKSDRWYAHTNLKPLIRRSDFYENLVNRRGDISRFVVLYAHEAYFDCGNKSYNYSITFLTPRNPLLVFPEEIRDPLEEIVDRLFAEKLGTLTTADAITINIYGDVFLEMLKDQDFKEKITRVFRRSKSISSEILSYFDPATQKFFDDLLEERVEISPFGIGQYYPPGDVLFLLEVFAKRFLILRNRLHHYEVVCKGFADSRQIHGGIPYQGGSNLELRRNQPERFKETNGGSRSIRNNLQLSIARGYAGAEAISKVFDSEIEGEERESVEVYYAGGGKIDGRPLDVYRKIELTIKRKSL
jgi:hypothetical protein